MPEVSGRHGQRLIDEGNARPVMGLVGSTLRKLQALPADTVNGIPGDGTVLVHGDFGPQNMLFDLTGSGRVTAVLDWEFAHLGQPIEDLAWAEWIVRMHHPDHVDSVEELLSRSGVSACWTDRHAAMVRRCHELLRYSRTVGLPAGEALWRERVAATEAWTSE
jgi:aminoglycoside phosphotransferase (APT) family kinase protein